MKKSTSGFTLVEILIVVIVIGILAAISIVAYNGTQARTRDAKRKSDIANIAKALELYYDDNGSYPPSANSSTVINPSWSASADASWNAFTSSMTGAIDTLPKDPLNTGSPLSSSPKKYGYAYFTGSYCGQVSRQWYLIVYRYESAPKEQFTDGNCSTNPLGEGYFTNGASFYRSVR